MATVAENLQTILDIKSDIKTAIINKGVSVADSDSFTTYADKIESIETGGGSSVLESITITENGTYTPNEGVDGFNEVNVDITTTSTYLLSPEKLYENYGEYYNDGYFVYEYDGFIAESPDNGIGAENFTYPYGSPEYVYTENGEIYKTESNYIIDKFFKENNSKNNLYNEWDGKFITEYDNSLISNETEISETTFYDMDGSEKYVKYDSNRQFYLLGHYSYPNNPYTYSEYRNYYLKAKPSYIYDLNYNGYGHLEIPKGNYRGLCVKYGNPVELYSNVFNPTYFSEYCILEDSYYVYGDYAYDGYYLNVVAPYVKLNTIYERVKFRSLIYKKVDINDLRDCYETFYGCTNLEEVNINKVSGSLNDTFYECRSLKKLGKIDCSEVGDISWSTFDSCFDLCDIGGFENLGENVNSYMDLNLSYSYKLTKQSILNIFNTIANGKNICHIYLNSLLTKELTDEDIAIATSKGWTVNFN